MVLAEQRPHQSLSNNHGHTGRKSFDDSSQTGRWTRDEHLLFLQGLEQHGKEWKKIAKLVKTRTLVQIRSHAQKYFSKLAAAEQSGQEVQGSLLMDGKRKKSVQKKKLGSGGDGNMKRSMSCSSMGSLVESAPQSPVAMKAEFPSSNLFHATAHHTSGFSVMSLNMAESQQPQLNSLNTGSMYQHHHTSTNMHAPMFQTSSYQLYSPCMVTQPPHHNSIGTTTTTVQSPQTQQVFAYAVPSVPCSASTFLPAQEDNQSDIVSDSECGRTSLADCKDGSTSTSSLSSYATTADAMDDLDPLDLFTPEELELFVHDFLPEETTTTIKRTVQVPAGFTDSYSSNDMVFDSEVLDDWLAVESSSTPTGNAPEGMSWSQNFRAFTC